MKVKLNNRGFAISTMIYSIFLIFLIFVSSLLALLAYRKNIFDAHKSAIYKESNKIPVVIVDNEDLSYEEKISFNLESGIKCTDCNIVSITLDDYEIPKEEYNNYLVTITVANGAVSLSGGPFNDYDYKNLKPYTKTWGDGFKALYKDGKEVAHVKIDGNTIQVHVSALGNLIFKATR